MKQGGPACSEHVQQEEQLAQLIQPPSTAAQHSMAPIRKPLVRSGDTPSRVSLAAHRVAQSCPASDATWALSTLAAGLIRPTPTFCAVSFHQKVQLREPGFEQWLTANVPIAGASAGAAVSDIDRAQQAFSSWPLLDEVECEHVDTPEKARIEKMRLLLSDLRVVVFLGGKEGSKRAHVLLFFTLIPRL